MQICSNFQIFWQRDQPRSEERKQRFCFSVFHTWTKNNEKVMCHVCIVMYIFSARTFKRWHTILCKLFFNCMNVITCFVGLLFSIFHVLHLPTVWLGLPPKCLVPDVYPLYEFLPFLAEVTVVVYVKKLCTMSDSKCWLGPQAIRTYDKNKKKKQVYFRCAHS